MEKRRLAQLQNQILYSLNLNEELKSRLDGELSSANPNFQNGKEFAEFLASLLRAIDSQLKWSYHEQVIEFSKITDGIGDSSITHLENQISEITRLIKNLTPMIKFVAGSRTPMNHWGLSSIVDRLCRSLYPEARVIIRPRWEFNYTYKSLTGEILNDVSATNLSDSSVGSAFEVITQKAPYFFSLAYPPIASRNFLFTSIWAHEIAHMADNIEAFSSSKQEDANKKTDKKPDEETDERNEDIEQYSSTRLLQKLPTLQISEENYDKLMSFQETARSGNLIKGQKDRLRRQIHKYAAAVAHVWARELFADIFSIHLFGPAALLAYAEYIGPAHGYLDKTSDLKYPTERIRLKTLLQEFEYWDQGSEWAKKIPPIYKRTLENELQCLRDLIKTDFEPALLFSGQKGKAASNQELLNTLYKVLNDNVDLIIEKLRPLLNNIKKHNRSCFLSPSDLEDISSNLYDLENDRPTVFKLDEKNENKLLALLMNVGWLTWLKKKNRANIYKFKGYDQIKRDYDNINLLIEKSIETAEINRWFSQRRPYGKQEFFDLEELEKKKGITSTSIPGEIAHGGIITRRIMLNRIQNDLKIIPLLDKKSQVGTCSLDVRLGNQFILTRTPLVASLDPIEIERTLSNIDFQNIISLPLGHPLILHPGQFVLGSTLEYFCIPHDLMGLLIGRSSWGRLGFVISTPNKVQPGFKGCLTLQLSNLGNIPISLYPCSRIGQIIFFSVVSDRN